MSLNHVGIYGILEVDAGEQNNITNKIAIHTNLAPEPIGCYSQAIKVSQNNSNATVYLSGQIGLDPVSMELADGVEAQAQQMFLNLKQVCIAIGGDINNIVKLNIYLLDMNDFAVINRIMAEYFIEPYPARAVIAVRALPKGALVEADGVMVL